MASADGNPDQSRKGSGATISGAEAFARDTSMSHALRDTLLQLSSTETTETGSNSKNPQIESGEGWAGSAKNVLDYFQKSLSLPDTASGQSAVSAPAREKSDVEALPQIADKSSSGSGSEDSFELVDKPPSNDEEGRTVGTLQRESFANVVAPDAIAISSDAAAGERSYANPTFSTCNDESFSCIDKYAPSSNQTEKSWTRKISTSIATCNNEALSYMDKYAPSSDSDDEKSWTHQLSTRAQGLYAAVASKTFFSSNQVSSTQLVVAKDATATQSDAAVGSSYINCNNEAFSCLDKYAPSSENDDKKTWTRQLSSRAQGLFATVSPSAASSKSKGVATSNEGEEITAHYQGMDYYDMCNQSVTDFSTWGAQMSSEASAWWRKEENWRVAFYICVFSIIGSLLRIGMAQLFGEECANPGTVGWIRSEQPLCVTNDGVTSRQGGIIFSDLPANMFGSFLLGMMQNGVSLNLAVDVPIAFLPSKDLFQGCNLLHSAIKMGFCGALTSFSSWNSEMVVMMFSFGDEGHNSEIIRALLGYIIGVQLALGSFIFGRNAAVYLHRVLNPGLAREMDAVAVKLTEGVPVNRNLPAFERRYLHELDDVQEEKIEPEHMSSLEQWKNTTKEHRRVNNEALPYLCDIEERVLKYGPTVIDDDMKTSSEKYGWDLKSLETWVAEKDASSFDMKTSTQSPSAKTAISVAVFLFVVFYTLLIIGVIKVNGDDAYSITYRTMLFSAIFAPPGALLRWRLSEYNGHLPGHWSWFPVGTFAANFSASIISIAMIAIDYVFGMSGNPHSFWVYGTCRAIKTGFAGSLSTVSTFSEEIYGFMELKAPKAFYSYYYTLFTIGMSCVCSVAVYAMIV
mmetsp:Transcript_13044/g.27632  ORF Transcript_13044/g.27632 Transcript_13044/m.27632 type:complete len:856 (-) Transcript_13044:107-2674(-)